MLTKQQFVFKKLIEDFIGVLDKLFPRESFRMYIVGMSLLTDNMFKDIFVETKDFFGKFKQEIEEKNEVFFDSLDPKEFSNDQMVLKEIAKLRQLYHSQDDHTKGIIWEYITKISNVLGA